MVNATADPACISICMRRLKSRVAVAAELDLTNDTSVSKD
jgi:hypothetical protein